jgi:hypothetical protein
MSSQEEAEAEAIRAKNNLVHDLVTKMLSIADAERYLGPLVVQNIIDKLSNQDIKTFTLVDKNLAACSHDILNRKKKAFTELHSVSQIMGHLIFSPL